MTELETIAREIHAKSQAPDADGMWRWITSWCPSGDWHDIGPGPREAFILMARTTLESMRFPTEAMALAIATRRRGRDQERAVKQGVDVYLMVDAYLPSAREDVAAAIQTMNITAANQAARKT